MEALGEAELLEFARAQGITSAQGLFFHHGEHPRISLLVVTKLQRLGSSTEFTVQTNTTKQNEKSLPLQGRRLKPSNDNPSEIKLNNALPCAQQKRN